MLVDDPNLPAAERIKHHVLATHALLEELQVLAQQMGEGDAITEKIKKFYGDVLFNFAIRFADCYSKLPQAGPTRVSSGTPEPTSKVKKPGDVELTAH